MVLENETEPDTLDAHTLAGGDAPEVALAHEGPVVVPRETDGLHYDSHSLALVPQQPPPPYKKRSVLLWILGIALAALIGLGAGIGIGYAVREKQGSGGSSSTSSSSTAITPSTQTVTVTISSASSSNTTSSASATSSAVTSGTSGIAAFSCNSTTPAAQYTSSNASPQTFTEVCFTQYPGGLPIWNSSSTGENRTNVIDRLAIYVYTFQACMDACAIYNSQQTSNAANGGVDQCQASSYDANLTFATAIAAGNCYLKSARGQLFNQYSGANYQLFASAYITADI